MAGRFWCSHGFTFHEFGLVTSSSRRSRLPAGRRRPDDGHVKPHKPRHSWCTRSTRASQAAKHTALRNDHTAIPSPQSFSHDIEPSAYSVGTVDPHSFAVLSQRHPNAKRTNLSRM